MHKMIKAGLPYTMLVKITLWMLSQTYYRERQVSVGFLDMWNIATMCVDTKSYTTNEVAPHNNSFICITIVSRANIEIFAVYRS